MKICSKCKLKKSLILFYRHAGMKDGYLNQCIECVKKGVKRHRKKNIERIRAYDRHRGNTDEHRAKVRDYHRRMSEALSEYKKHWAEQNKDKTRAAKQRYIAQNPDKRFCHVALNNAVRDKKIMKEPCEKCGEKKSEAHHEDYSKPLEVLWLCRKCHARHHRKYK